MSEPPESDYTCENCGAELGEEDDFCATCGILFRSDINCVEHPTQPAEAVCLICHRSLCNECLRSTGKLFFCGKHEAYDIYERSASVFGTADTRLAQIAFQALEENAFHPFLVSRAIVPVTGLGRLIPNKHVGPHLVLVPFDEVDEAEALLTNLEIH